MLDNPEYGVPGRVGRVAADFFFYHFTETVSTSCKRS